MKTFDTINVIPFIDILLVLLAMVLTTATFVNTGQLDIDLPKAQSATAVTDSDPIEIAIDASEQIYLDGVTVSLEELETRLLDRSGAPSQVLASSDEPSDGKSLGDAEASEVLPLGNTIAVRLLVDENVAFAQFVSVADLLKRLSVENLSIVTSPSS